MVGSLYLRLLTGPLELGFAAEPLRSAIQDNLPRHRVSLRNVQIYLEPTGKLGVRVNDLIVRDEDGSILNQAKTAEVVLETGGLALGRLRAEKLRVVGMISTIHINDYIGPSSFAARFASTGPIFLYNNLSSTLQDLSHLGSLAKTADDNTLNEISINFAKLNLEVAIDDSARTFENVDVGIRHPSADQASLEVASIDPKFSWRIQVDTKHSSSGEKIKVVSDRLPLAATMLLLGHSPESYGSDISLSLQFDAFLDADGRDPRLSFGSGRINLPSGGYLEMSKTDLQVVEVDGGSPLLRISLDVKGTSEETRELLALPRFKSQLRAGPGCLNRNSASISGASAGLSITVAFLI